VVNLVLAVPLMILTLFLTWKGKLLGFLFFPGVLFYIPYIYSIYLIGLPRSILFLPYLLLVILSIITLIMLVLELESLELKTRLSNHIPVRFAGYILFIITCLIVVYQTYSILFVGLIPVMFVEGKMAGKVLLPAGNACQDVPHGKGLAIGCDVLGIVCPVGNGTSRGASVFEIPFPDSITVLPVGIKVPAGR
jgi:hypothetical protein